MNEPSQAPAEVVWGRGPCLYPSRPGGCGITVTVYDVGLNPDGTKLIVLQHGPNPEHRSRPISTCSHRHAVGTETCTFAIQADDWISRVHEHQAGQ